MTTEPPHQLDDDGDPLTPDVAVDVRRQRRGASPDLSPDPSNDTDIDAAVRARRERNTR